jgi:hypothetical protein
MDWPCKIVLYNHPIKNYHFAMSYQESGVKWGDIAENMVDIGWQCKITLHCWPIPTIFSANSSHFIPPFWYDMTKW